MAPASLSSIGRIEHLLLLLAALFGLSLVPSNCPVRAQSVGFTVDFETGDLRGWTATGEAFRCQPTLDDNPTARNRGQPAGLQGHFWIGTYECFQGRAGQSPGAVQGDGPQGTLTSRPFQIPRGTLSFLVGGGSSHDTRVELLVGDPIEQHQSAVLEASGKDSETMRKVTWDLTPHAGKIGQLRVVDQSSGPWGHINVDDFKFLPEDRAVITAIPVYPKPPTHVPSTGGSQAPQPIQQIIVGVPNLAGRTMEESARILRQRHLRLGEVNAGDAGGKESTVYAQRPQPETLVEAGTGVDLWIVRPRLTVPSLIGKTLPDANAILSQAQLHVGNLTEKSSNEESGTILAQAPPPGTLVSAGAAVDLQISKKIIPKLSIEADNLRPILGQPVVFAARLEPAPEGAEYQFFFGDGTPTNWSTQPTATHTYSVASDYRAHVVANVLGYEISSGTILLQIQQPRFQISLAVKPERAGPNIVITFAASINPPSREAEYSFVFGDGAETPWSTRPVAEHAFHRAGSYQARVFVRTGSGKIVASERAGITITPVIPWKIIVVAGLAAIVILGGGIYFHKYYTRQQPLPLRIHFNPHVDPGSQDLELPASLDWGADVRVRVVKSLGDQTLESEGVLQHGKEGAHD